MKRNRTDERWQVVVNDSILNEKFGPVFIGARKDSRGPWKSGDDLPDHVRWFLNLQRHGGRWFLFDFAGLSVVDIRRLPSIDKWQRADTRGWKFLTRIPAPAPTPKPRKIPARTPAIRSLADLCEHFGADTPGSLNRRIYKDTDCGASISLYLSDGTAIHNGDRRWDTLPVDAPIRGFTIQAIVEGSDAEVNSDEFVLPVTTEEVDHWIADMEAQAADLWEEANADE